VDIILKVLGIYLLTCIAIYSFGFISKDDLLFNIGLIFMAFAFISVKNISFFSNKAFLPIQYVGLYSYGVYLTHTYVILLLEQIGETLNTLVCVLITLLLAMVVGSIIEKLDAIVRKKILARIF